MSVADWGMARFDLTDRVWAILEPLLPEQGGHAVVGGVIIDRSSRASGSNAPEPRGPTRRHAARASPKPGRASTPHGGQPPRAQPSDSPGCSGLPRRICGRTTSIRLAGWGADREQGTAPNSPQRRPTALSCSEPRRRRAGHLRSHWSAAWGPFADTEEVTGSIPVSPTKVCAGQRLVTGSTVMTVCLVPLTVGAPQYPRSQTRRSAAACSPPAACPRPGAAQRRQLGRLNLVRHAVPTR
jgi:hypothetical protein